MTEQATASRNFMAEPADYAGSLIEQFGSPQEALAGLLHGLKTQRYIMPKGWLAAVVKILVIKGL